MNTKHTPGPWSIGVPGPNGCPTIGTAQGLMTAMIAHSYNEPSQAAQARANAKLIGAAPELLEALQELLDNSSIFHSAIEQNEMLGMDFEEWAIKTKAAIKKATE